MSQILGEGVAITGKATWGRPAIVAASVGLQMRQNGVPQGTVNEAIKALLIMLQTVQHGSKLHDGKGCALVLVAEGNRCALMPLWDVRLFEGDTGNG